MKKEKINAPEKSFDQKKREYFSRLALQARDALKLHRDIGLLWEKKNGAESWRNVSEHCLVEIARVEILAEKLRLPGNQKKDLMIAASLHDFFKKEEMAVVKEDINQGGSGRVGNLKAKKRATDELIKAGFSENIIRLVNSIGGQPEELFETKNILDKEFLSNEDIAFLVMHYVDDYTRGSDWVTSAAIERGITINDVDRRIQKNLNNPNYQKMNEDSLILHKGHPFF